MSDKGPGSRIEIHRMLKQLLKEIREVKNEMNVFEESKENARQGDRYLLLLNKKEARLLIEMTEAAAEANKRKRTWKTMFKKLEACLWCY